MHGWAQGGAPIISRAFLLDRSHRPCELSRRWSRIAQDLESRISLIHPEKLPSKALALGFA